MLNFQNEISRTLPLNMPKLRPNNDGEPILYAYGCALLEEDTGDCFIYKVVNLTTNKSIILSRRKTPLATNEIEKTVERIKESGIAGKARYEVDCSINEKINLNKCREILYAIFKDIMPKYGYSVRTEQIALADEILKNMYDRKVLLAESEVGTGKTLAYLTAAILSKRGRLNDFWNRTFYPGMQCVDMPYMPIVIATSSIALQKAIVNDYIPELSDILIGNGIIKTPLTVALRKGREHYICDLRLLSYCENEHNDKIKLSLIELLNPFADIDLAETKGLTPYIKRHIRIPSQCPELCPHYGVCRYHNFLRESMNPAIDIQVTNHNYLLADALHRVNGKRPLLPNYQSLIIDEAHKLLSAARSMYGKNLSSEEAKQILKYIDKLQYDMKKAKQTLYDTAKKLYNESRRLFRYFAATMTNNAEDDTERYCVDFCKDVTRHLRNIRNFADMLYEQLVSEPVDKRFKYRKSQILWVTNRVRENAAALVAHKELICWLEQSTDGEITLCSIPKNLDKRLYTDIWSNGIPTILTSGTLSAGSDFSHTKRTLGLNRLGIRIEETSKPSPFNYRENALLYISEVTPFPDRRNNDYISVITDEVERLIKASHGHSAVLFTSYDTMGRVHAALSERSLPFSLMKLERKTSAAIEQFKQADNAVLFASGALWEGIDIPGDTLSLLIIVKLPFQVPDPIGEYEQTLYSSLFEYKNRVIVPEMLLKLKQGFGRLIRTETDTGCVAILDSRANSNGAYRKRVLDALPDCTVTADVADVERFIKAKKPPEYFSNETNTAPFPESGKGAFSFKEVS